MKIANKISFLFFIAVVILIVSAAGVIYYIEKENLKSVIFNHLATTVRSKARRIETLLESSKEAVRQLSKSLIIERFLLTSKENGDYGQRLNDANRRLKDTSEVLKYFYNLLVLDKEGVVVVASEEIDVGLNKSMNSYFLDAKKNTFIKDAYLSSYKKTPSLAFFLPITDSNTGEFLGVVVGRSNFEGLNKITTDRAGLGETGENYLVNKHGYTITLLRFAEDSFLKQRIDDENTRRAFGDVKKFGTEEHKHIPFIYTNYKGVKVLGIHDHIHIMQWVLVAEIDEKEALAPLWKIKFLLISIIIVTLILAWLIGIFIGGLISRPIHMLHKGSEAIGAGNLDYKVGTDAKDEIGQLSQAFDKMTEDLKKTTTSITNLNKEIAERKKAEEKQRILMEDLETINKELDDFTYIVSHDLKEPLRSIDAFSKFIEEDYKDNFDEEGRNYFMRIRANAGRMQNLIEDLLEISRIERRENFLENVQPEELIDEVRFRLEYAIEQKNAEIIVRDRLPRIFCDRVRLTEVFLNLISNAIKFNDKPEPRIEIGSNQRGIFYEFYVKDNGLGIEKRYFDKIFEIFQRLEKREEYEGTGAGLTIVKKIVQMHCGKIWVESKIGKGTTFYFTIPREKGVIRKKRRIGEILIEKKILTEAELKEGLAEQKRET